MASFLPLLMLLLICATTTLPFSAAARWRCLPEERQVLNQINQGFGNPFSFWVPSVDCCKWEGVFCNPNTSRVVYVVLRNVGFAGDIPAAVGQLPELENLIIHKMPNLTGGIPSSIANLKRLTLLRVSWTSVSGPIPNWISGLVNLQTLDLSYNRLNGSIPPSLSRLPSIQTINLERNHLTGPIPESFGQFPSTFQWLHLSSNDLSGPIPDSFWDIFWLGEFDWVDVQLQRNRFTGFPSRLFNNASRPTPYIDLSRNQFDFDLTAVVNPPKTLRSLDLSHNEIRGSIPVAIADLTALNAFNVSYNRLCGEIPRVGSMLRFDNTSFVHNECLCGPPLPVKC